MYVTLIVYYVRLESYVMLIVKQLLLFLLLFTLA